MEAQTKKPIKPIFWRSPGGVSDLAPESEIFVFFGFLGFFGSLAVWVCTEIKLLLSKTYVLLRKTNFWQVKLMFCLEKQVFA